MDSIVRATDLPTASSMTTFIESINLGGDRRPSSRRKRESRARERRPRVAGRSE